MNCITDIVKKLRESRVHEDKGSAEYICKEIVVDNQGVMEIICYDTVEDEDFEKYIGQVDDPTARKNARLILRDWKFEVPKDIKNELIGTFGLEEFGYSIEENSNPVYKETVDFIEGELYGVRYHDHYEAAEEVEALGFRVIDSAEDHVTLTKSGIDIVIPLIKIGSRVKFDFDSIEESVNEASERMEFATDSEAYEWAEENGYKVDKIQNGTGSKACICWMSKVED